MAGWSTTTGRPRSTVALKDEVETDHVRRRRASTGRSRGRYLNIRVEVEKSVNPVSLGEVVTDVKN